MAKRRRSGIHTKLIITAILCLIFSLGNLQQFHNLSSYLTVSNYHDEPSPLPQQHNIAHHNIHNKRNSTKPKPISTLVHFDPHFIGGFRNQHMRFIGLVAHAIDHDIRQILLPSLRWVDINNIPNSIHHELLFDVDYWNKRADEFGLPTLVDYDPDILEGYVIANQTTLTITEAYYDNNELKTPCWNISSSLYSGVDESLIRNAGTNLRRTNAWAMIGQGDLYSHCARTMGDKGWHHKPETIIETAKNDKTPTNNNTVYRYTHLVPHGGLAGVGNLWSKYMQMQSTRNQKTEPYQSEEFGVYPEHVPVEKAIYDLLRPSQHLQKYITDSINRAVQNHTQQNSDHQPRLLAIHPRIEQDMLEHRCNKHMEPNITRLLDHIQNFTPFFDGNNTNSYRFDSVFMAVSKEGVEKKSNKGGHIGDIVNHNRLALRNYRKNGLFDKGIPLFESKTESAAKIKLPMISNENASSIVNFVSVADLGVIELVASIIDFFTAVSAHMFVGVKGSSFSTDVATVRYYQHKEDGGAKNYVVGPNGIERRNGPPAPHSC